MKPALAERLLVRVLDWDEQQIAQELSWLKDIARHKYDDYQPFSPGIRFIESLARWLDQFDKAHRQAAYDFIRDRLVYFSLDEIRHLVEMAYPDHVRPYLLQQAAIDLGVNRWHVSRLAQSTAFKIRQRQCLFLGLSDGARIDVFRRANPELNHEQLWQTHEVATDRAEKLLKTLTEHIGKMRSAGSDGASICPNAGVEKFKTIVLLDDFSASGRSYYMPESNGVSGKIAQFHKRITNAADPISKLVDSGQVELIILLYIATEQARDHLERHSKELWSGFTASCRVEVVQPVAAAIRVSAATDAAFAEVIDRYYDHSVFDEHMERGGTADAKYGFAAGSVPVVLHHNAPNNSIALLWSYDDTSVRGLFPRIRRHKEDP